MNAYQRLALVVLIAFGVFLTESVNWTQPVEAQAVPEGCYGDVSVQIEQPHQIYIDINEKSSYTVKVINYHYNGTPFPIGWLVNGVMQQGSANWTFTFSSDEPGDYTLVPMIGENGTECIFEGKVIVTVEPSEVEQQAADLQVGIKFSSEEPDLAYLGETLTTTVVITNNSQVSTFVYSNLRFFGIHETGGDLGRAIDEQEMGAGAVLTYTYTFTPQVEGEFNVLVDVGFAFSGFTETNPSDNEIKLVLNVVEFLEIPVEASVSMTFEEPILRGVSETFTVTTRFIPEGANTQVSFFCETDQDPEEVFEFDTPKGSFSAVVEFAPAKECLYTAYIRTYADDNNQILALADVTFQVLDPLGPGPTPAVRLLFPLMQR